MVVFSDTRRAFNFLRADTVDS